MKKQLIVLGCLVAGVLSFPSCESKRLTADNYADRSIPVPYGTPIEDKDISDQVDSIRDVGEKVTDAAKDATDRLSSYADTAGEVIDAADKISDAVGTGAKAVGSLAEKASEFINNKLP